MIHGIETRSDDGELKALFGWMEQHSCCGVSTRSTCWLSRQQQQTVPRLLIRSFGGFYFTTGTGSGWEKRRRGEDDPRKAYKMWLGVFSPRRPTRTADRTLGSWWWSTHIWAGGFLRRRRFLLPTTTTTTLTGNLCNSFRRSIALISSSI